MPSSSHRVERVKPLLGTFVRIALECEDRAFADRLIRAAYREIADIHRLMSFQEADSDISTLNRDAHRRSVRVDARTYDVLKLCARISDLSSGIFDITVAPDVAEALGTLAPGSVTTPDPAARWHDVELLGERLVRFRRPLWIDVSGIAKGYAVDRAIEFIAAAGGVQASVNAGGDLRIQGPAPESVRVHVNGAAMYMPVVVLRNESIASSGHRLLASGRQCDVTHIDGIRRRETAARFVSVLAPRCAIADGLTKVVMARGAAAQSVLRTFGARALLHEASSDWREVA